MSQPEDLHAYFHYYDYIIPGTYLHPMEMTAMTPTFCAYIPTLDYMSSLTSTITYVTSPFGMALSSFDHFTHPQTSFYELHEDENIVANAYVIEYDNEQLQDNHHLVEVTPAKRPRLEKDDTRSDNLEQQQQQQQQEQEEPASKPTEETEATSNRAYQTEHGYLVEEPSSEPSEEG